MGEDPGEERDSRRSRAVELVRAGRLEESLPFWRAEASSGAEGALWVRSAAVEAMSWRDLTVAGALSSLSAAARWGSRWYPTDADGLGVVPTPESPPRTLLSVPKLRHDAEQFAFLRKTGALGAEFDEVIKVYQALADRLEPAGPESRFPLDDDAADRIGDTYNRIVHIAATDRVDRALSDAWDAEAVEEAYLSRPPGLAVIDNFLSDEALEEVRRFCTQSTVWSGTRYAEGRLGAFFVDGFNPPILLQVAEELRAALPRVIGDSHPLRQMWGFKYAPDAGTVSATHADFAAVNVNFWVTPTEANLDDDCGGLVVHDVGAPLSWDFATYNEQPDLIDRYLAARGSTPIRVPYRGNRAIVFNSDLFHSTERIRFRPEYLNRRINVTFLYGDRAHDQHHPEPDTTTSEPAPAPSTWRSAALKRARR